MQNVSGKGVSEKDQAKSLDLLVQLGHANMVNNDKELQLASIHICEDRLQRAVSKKSPQEHGFEQGPLSFPGNRLESGSHKNYEACIFFRKSHAQYHPIHLPPFHKSKNVLQTQADRKMFEMPISGILFPTHGDTLSRAPRN